MATKRELCLAEDRGWAELVELIESLTLGQAEEPGYEPGGWSVRDLMVHVAAWQAEAARVLQQIGEGTYRDEPLDVEAMDARFLDANRGLPLPVVRAELWAARTRMISELNELADPSPEAEEWFRESGPAHYEEHLPRLREWVSELLEDGPAAPGGAAPRP